jgi:hypothetical protein
MNEKHEMILETTHPSGAEEWYCPTCGRRFMLTWPPEYKKIVLSAGDELASHGGGKGGLKISQIQVNEVEEPELPQQIRSALEDIVKDFDFDESSGVDSAA